MKYIIVGLFDDHEQAQKAKDILKVFSLGQNFQNL